MAGKTLHKTLHKGDDVNWTWGSAKAHGEVTAVHDHDVTRTIKGKTIKRKGSSDEPAVEVKSDKGGRALKSASELHRE